VIFVHEDPEFRLLLELISSTRGVDPGVVEKDYWVTHTLWAIQAQGWELWFKGGTSLSKGFSLIERFSEDLDLRLQPGPGRTLPEVSSWTKDSPSHVASRRAHLEALGRALVIPGAVVQDAPEHWDDRCRNAAYRVEYPRQVETRLGGVLREHVLLEVGDARVTPFVPCDLSSFVHDQLREAGQAGEFIDNRALSVRCVHPLVTALEKLDAISRRFSRDPVEAATFIRHYEDVARVLEALPRLPPLPGSLADLVVEMCALRQLRAPPTADDPAFLGGGGAAWDAVERAYLDIAPMFWGPRVPLSRCCALIRAWLTRPEPPPAP
jgi:hypothetical protein